MFLESNLTKSHSSASVLAISSVNDTPKATQRNNHYHPQHGKTNANIMIYDAPKNGTIFAVFVFEKKNMNITMATFESIENKDIYSYLSQYREPTPQWLADYW